MTDTTTQIACHLRTVRGSENPIVFVKDGKVFASSEDVATFFGKSHAHVLRDVRLLISNNNSCASNFGFITREVTMHHGGKRNSVACNMNRDGFTLLAMGFTGKRALAWKLRYIEAFNAMEAKLAAPEPGPTKGTRARPRYQPEFSSTGRPVAMVDQVDSALDLLVTAETALYATEMLDAETIRAIRGTIEQAVKRLAPARAALNAMA